MIRKTAFAAAILAFSTAAGATGLDSFLQTQLTLTWSASRIVGTYHTDAQVRPCGSNAPFQPVVNTMSFNYGGTVLENPRFPPIGAPNAFGIPGQFTRSAGLGTWTYNPRKNNFTMTLRYDFFVDGAFYGTGTVERDIDLSRDNNTASGAVTVTMYAVDGSVLRKLCGTGVSTRI